MPFDPISVFTDFYFKGLEDDRKKLELCFDMLAGLAEALIDPEVLENEKYLELFRRVISNNMEVLRANLQFLLNKTTHDLEAWAFLNRQLEQKKDQK